MNEMYRIVRRDMWKAMTMRKIALGMGKKKQKEKVEELRSDQDDLYKRTMFKKNFLRARSELNGRERT